MAQIYLALEISKNSSKLILGGCASGSTSTVTLAICRKKSISDAKTKHHFLLVRAQSPDVRLRILGCM